jgi:hypothetical protein
MTSFSSCQSHIFYKYISGEGSRNPSSCPAIAHQINKFVAAWEREDEAGAGSERIAAFQLYDVITMALEMVGIPQ